MRQLHIPYGPEKLSLEQFILVRPLKNHQLEVAYMGSAYQNHQLTQDMEPI